MPKLRNVTAAELTDLENAAMEAGSLATALQSRIQQGYSDNVPAPISVASSLLAASRSLADLAQTMIVKAAMQEQKRELETKLRSQAG